MVVKTERFLSTPVHVSSLSWSGMMDTSVKNLDILTAGKMATRDLLVLKVC